MRINTIIGSLLLVAMAATSASAECSWVLWTRVEFKDGTRTDWASGGGAYPTYSKC